MDKATRIVEVEVEFDKDVVEYIDKMAAARGCDRVSIINEAVGRFAERQRDLLREHQALPK